MFRPTKAVSPDERAPATPRMPHPYRVARRSRRPTRCGRGAARDEGARRVSATRRGGGPPKECGLRRSRHGDEGAGRASPEASDEDAGPTRGSEEVAAWGQHPPQSNRVSHPSGETISLFGFQVLQTCAFTISPRADGRPGRIRTCKKLGVRVGPFRPGVSVFRGLQPRRGGCVKGDPRVSRPRGSFGSPTLYRLS